jgi:tetratricopeptide (TPR) repeat protein
LIDLSEGDEDLLEICVLPLVNSLIIHGTQKTIDVILENSTEYDWISLIILDNKLDNLSLHKLRVLFLDYLMTLNPLNSKLNIWIGLIAISILETDKAIYYLEKIDVLPLVEDDDTDILFQMGIIESNFGNFNRAYEFYKKCLSIQIKKFGLDSTEVAESFNNIGLLLNKIDYKKSLKYYFKSLKIYVKKIECDVESNKASIYNNIAEVYYYKNNFKEALNLYNNSLDIKLKIHGKNHPSIAVLYNNIGALLKSKGKYEKALIYYYKCLEIESNIFGDYNSDIARTLNNIGTLLYVKSDYEKSLIYHKKSFEIRIRTLIKAHEEIVQSYFNIGLCYKALLNYGIAIINFQKCYEILKKGSFPYQIAQCYEAINHKENALDYYIQSAEIRKEDVEINEDAFQDTIMNVKRLAKELGKEEELPEWMKNNN